MKIPAIKCDSNLWMKLKPYLIEYGYDIQFVGANWDVFPILVIDLDGVVGMCVNVSCPMFNRSIAIYNYNRELVDDMDTFLKRAAILKDKLYYKILKNGNFKKSDLKTGMIVHIGNTMCLVMDDHLISPNNYFNLDDYDDNLKNIKDNNLNITRVSTHPDWSNGFNNGLLSGYILWERPNIKTVTKQEIANMLGVNINELNITD